ncbi:hypothetical protein UXP00_03615 [Enterobacter asburiae]|uniref:hypothetical protein n=1 Tax=Enterobacter asburiae TaxID=61645 RepID=UPI002FD1D379
MSNNKLNTTLQSLDAEIEQFAQTNFQLEIEKLLMEEIPKINNGEYFDAYDLQSIKKEEILDPKRNLTNIEQRLWKAAKNLSLSFNVPSSIFSPLIILTILSLSKGCLHESKALTNILFSYKAYRSSFEKAPSKLGALGGRPVHPRKTEALGLARQRWQQLPRASIASVAAYVKSQLDAKYTDGPKIPSIKKWLTEEVSPRPTK